MILVLETRHLDAVRLHGEADYPHEACGLIGGVVEGDRKVAVQLVPLVNARRDTPRNRYLIDPEAFRRGEARLVRDALEVIGVYHSHPEAPAVPSAFDREHAWPWYSYVIVSVRSRRAGEARSWTLSADRDGFEEEPLLIEDRKVLWPSQS
jgi:proteasome lid subunit RPN8/RPN11